MTHETPRLEVFLAVEAGEESLEVNGCLLTTKHPSPHLIEGIISRADPGLIYGRDTDTQTTTC